MGVEEEGRRDGEVGKREGGEEREKRGKMEVREGGRISHVNSLLCLVCRSITDRPLQLFHLDINLLQESEMVFKGREHKVHQMPQVGKNPCRQG